MLEVKNMVCDRCIESVKHSLNQLNIEYNKVILGSINLLSELNQDQVSKLDELLHQNGFELLVNNEAILVNKIKSFIIKKVQSGNIDSNKNISSELEEILDREYSSISKIFSHKENTTIEQFLIHQKTEKAKELISYKEMTFAEIAFFLDYSSPAHFSNQFKKETGFTPGTYQKSDQNDRTSLDKV